MKSNRIHKTSISVIFILLLSMTMAGCVGSSYPLHAAAGTGGDIGEVRELIAQGADVNLKGRADRTPLMSAVYYGNFEIAKLLIENGADIDTAIMFLEGGYSDKRAALAGKNWLVQYQTTLKSQKPAGGDNPEKLPPNSSAQAGNGVGQRQSNPGATRQKLAVLDLEAVDVDVDLAYAMSVALRDELHSYGKYEILSREDLMAIAKRLSLQQGAGDECADDQCLVSYGKSLGTRFMVAGVLSKVGTTYSVSLRMLDTDGDNPGVMNRVSERCKCSQDELFEMVAMVAARLIDAERVPSATMR